MTTTKKSLSFPFFQSNFFKLGKFIPNQLVFIILIVFIIFELEKNIKFQKSMKIDRFDY